jgi:hypothetical protein
MTDFAREQDDASAEHQRERAGFRDGSLHDRRERYVAGSVVEDQDPAVGVDR